MANIQIPPPIRGKYDEIWAGDITRRANQLIQGAIGGGVTVLAPSIVNASPGTDYPTGLSSRVVANGETGWPVSTGGVVTALKTDANHVYSEFVSELTKDIYWRKWDSMPVDHSDTFTGANNSAPSSYLWETSTTIPPYIYDNKLRCYAPAAPSFSKLTSNFRFIGDFEYSIEMSTDTNVAGTAFGVLMSTSANRLPNGAPSVTSSGDIRVERYGSANFTVSPKTPSTSTSAGFTDKYWKVKRAGTTGTVSYKANLGDAWTDIAITVGASDYYVALYQQAIAGAGVVPANFDNFTVISGTVIDDSPPAATWSTWEKKPNQTTLISPNALNSVIATDSGIDVVALLTKIGDGTNNTVIEEDGTLRFDGTATTWNDINTSFSSMASVGATILDVLTIGGNKFKAFIGSGAVAQQADGSLEILHDYKEGSDITPHIHWMPEDANTGDVKFTLGYRWWNGGGTMPAETLLSITSAAGGVQYQENRSNFATISGAGMTMGSRFVFRVFRDPADAADTYGHYAIGLDFGIHYEKDTTGSRQITTK